jgi:hypothetical protein
MYCNVFVKHLLKLLFQKISMGFVSQGVRLATKQATSAGNSTTSGGKALP